MPTASSKEAWVEPIRTSRTYAAPLYTWGCIGRREDIEEMQVCSLILCKTRQEIYAPRDNARSDKGELATNFDLRFINNMST